jgi:sterol desaturase/sphingolipid hydroxylase (fatty acid hydroxylase superfamily)
VGLGEEPSSLAASRGVNYGIVFLLFDHLFGTYAPARTATGADDIGREAAVASSAVS